MVSAFNRLSLKTRLILAFAFATLLVAGLDLSLRNGPLLRCLTVHWRDAGRLAPGAYAVPRPEPQRQTELTRLHLEARTLLAAFFGQQKADPRILFLSEEKLLSEYGGKTGRPLYNHRTPFGAMLVLGPSKTDTYSLVQELVRIELDARLGWWTAHTRIPVWFQEGLALVVSGNTRYEQEALQEAIRVQGHLPPLEDLHTWRQFHALASENPALAYGLAYREVALWTRKVGTPGVLELLRKIGEGERFEAAYKEIEKGSKPLLVPRK